ncbi:transglycosylase SLT domain-containing protein [Roseovarius sp. SCSIO 43702]|uniref:transglycosylase SLT domain-containing protein n=1 Tax=Roseovarius sp. SCSIO 43702 TaxID=2823043 RepID=UPI001C733C51|nr:transglycosylase SLT domain-containing protein [Roseovarius sp. SCSIO 43702]QYX58178.1 transglycosylase SLT domain-containing protein [Roseovarius sp. SCSIO 43702]
MIRLPLFLVLCLGLLPVLPPPAAAEITMRAAGLETSLRPVARPVSLPRMRWAKKREATLWTHSAMAALGAHGAPLVRTVPQDIDSWCPAYRGADARVRKAFWVGLLSALAKHESTYRADAVGGGGRWFGLLQILPATARSYGCAARTGRELTHGPANLACAIRIMARTVPRDRAIAVHSGRWRGVAADWGPMTSKEKRRDMKAWLRSQPYCQGLGQVRPQARPDSAWPVTVVQAGTE